jgi:glycosyltransferase involved in cell wall biosynthesis
MVHQMILPTLFRRKASRTHSAPRLPRDEEAGPTAARRPLMFAYWGRMGPVSRWMLDLAEVAQTQCVACSFSYSNSNELLEQFRELGGDAFPVPTFQKATHALYRLDSIYDIRRQLRTRFQQDKTRAFVSLMSHVWSPLVASEIRKAGARHIVIVHDADPHPGDRSSLATRWILREAAMADHVIALSHSVGRKLVSAYGFAQDKISILFHPDLNYGSMTGLPSNESGPLRVLFVGRILAYKGLGLLADAVESLRRRGASVTLGVYGRGEISPELVRKLSAMDTTVDNRWLTHEELAQVFSCYDVVVTPYTEASQSGVIAAAYGAGLPVITTPVGGLIEQVTSGKTGLIAESATVDALADAISQLVDDRALLARLRNGVAATRNHRSMRRFFEEIHRIALQGELGRSASESLK